MRAYTVDEIRICFSRSSDFNEIFDAFEAAIATGVRDVELYRQLFWNHSLTADEIRLFGEKLASVFPNLAYDIFLWLASVFEATYGTDDNFELAFHYFQRAAKSRPAEPDPYLDACDCYDPDLNIPPVAQIIEFMKQGINAVTHPSQLYKRLARLHELSGDLAEAEMCRRKADELDNPRNEQQPPA